jgi:hypothetical protein
VTRRGNDLARVMHHPQDTADIGVIRQVDHRPVAARDENRVAGQDLLIAQVAQTEGGPVAGNRCEGVGRAPGVGLAVLLYLVPDLHDPLRGQSARHPVVLREHPDEVDVASPGPVRC